MSPLRYKVVVYPQFRRVTPPVIRSAGSMRAPSLAPPVTVMWGPP
jgi:hypothetical protein